MVTAKRTSVSLFGVPDHAAVASNVQSEIVRFYLYWRIFYLLGAVCHFFMIFMFWQAGVFPMALFNIASVAVFVGAFLLLRRGYYRSALWIACTELTLHGILATICIGTQYWFQNYAFVVSILLFIQPFYSARFSMVITSLTLASSALVTYYAINVAPLYIIPPRWSDPMAVTFMVLWPVFVLIMVLPFIWASAQAERKLASAYAESESLLLNILPDPT